MYPVPRIISPKMYKAMELQASEHGYGLYCFMHPSIKGGFCHTQQIGTFAGPVLLSSKPLVVFFNCIQGHPECSTAYRFYVAEYVISLDCYHEQYLNCPYNEDDESDDAHSYPPTMWMPMPHTQQSIIDLTIEIPQFETLEPASGLLSESVDWSGVVLYHMNCPNTNIIVKTSIMTTTAFAVSSVMLYLS